MYAALRTPSLLMLCFLVLTACAAPPPSAPAPPFTPAPRALPETVEAVPIDRVELAAGQYQLIMFYSPL